MAAPKNKSKAFNLRKEVKDMKEWLATPEQEEFQWAESRRSIANALSSPNDETVTSFRAELGQLHAWKSTLGAVAVLEGNVAGWGDLNHGLAFSFCDVQIAFGNYLDRSLPKEGALCDIEFPLILSTAILFHHHSFADWCGQIFVDSYLSGKGPFRDWKLTPLSPFITMLYARWRGIDVSKGAVGRKLGGYEGFFKHWDDPEKLSTTVRKACDYHWENTEYTESRVTEFEQSPYDVFPVEILAYQQIRRELGMPMATVDHPLLNTPLAHVPERIPSIKDDLVARITAFLHQKLPSTRAVTNR